MLHLWLGLPRLSAQPQASFSSHSQVLMESSDHVHPLILLVAAQGMSLPLTPSAKVLIRKQEVPLLTALLAEVRGLFPLPLPFICGANLGIIIASTPWVRHSNIQVFSMLDSASQSKQQCQACHPSHDVCAGTLSCDASEEVAPVFNYRLSSVTEPYPFWKRRRRQSHRRCQSKFKWLLCELLWAWDCIWSSARHPFLEVADG